MLTGVSSIFLTFAAWPCSSTDRMGDSGSPDWGSIPHRATTKYTMRSKLHAIFGLYCPACREGTLFPSRSTFFDYSFKMNMRCPVCNENFFREPGFYYGAMFISYIFSGFFSLAFCGVLILGFGIQWEYALIALSFVLALGFGYLFKVSRSIWLQFFVPYKGNHTAS